MAQDPSAVLSDHFGAQLDVFHGYGLAVSHRQADFVREESDGRNVNFIALDSHTSRLKAAEF